MMQTHMTFARLNALAAITPPYLSLRAERPEVPARLVKQYLDDPGGYANFGEFICAVTRGHKWSYTGTQYGGDDESFGGEGRCLCIHCGADGDA